jgi:hypothetical protein
MNKIKTIAAAIEVQLAASHYDSIQNAAVRAVTLSSVLTHFEGRRKRATNNPQRPLSGTMAGLYSVLSAESNAANVATGGRDRNVWKAKERAIEMQKEDILSKPETLRGQIVEGRIAKRLPPMLHIPEDAGPELIDGLSGQTLIVKRDGRSTIDLLHAAKGVKLVALFSPEHGIRGTADEKVGDSIDEKTKLPIYSLYGDAPKRAAGQSDADYAAAVLRAHAPKPERPTDRM